MRTTALVALVVAGLGMAACGSEQIVSPSAATGIGQDAVSGWDCPLVDEATAERILGEEVVLVHSHVDGDPSADGTPRAGNGCFIQGANPKHGEPSSLVLSTGGKGGLRFHESIPKLNLKGCSGATAVVDATTFTYTKDTCRRGADVIAKTLGFSWGESSAGDVRCALKGGDRVRPNLLHSTCISLLLDGYPVSEPPG